MKVLLNLISSRTGIDKSPVIHWALRYLNESHGCECVCITPEPVEVGPANMKQIVLQPPRNKTAFAAWKKIKLYPLVRKQQSDVIITWEVLKTGDSARQVLIASPVEPVSFVKTEKKRNGLDKLLANAEKNCACIVVFSEKERCLIAEKFPSLKETLRTIYRVPFPLNDFSEFDDREAVKEKWSSGNEFFMVPSGIATDRLTLLLKGFSGFKKWQKSNMQLLLSFSTDAEAAAIQALIKNYRFKESVRMISTKDDYWKVVAAAYAAILPEKFDSDFRFLFKAMAFRAPVLIPEESMYAEITGNAGFLFNADDKKAVTGAMLHLFRDEQVRGRHILLGNEVVDKWRSYDPASTFFESIPT